MIGVEGDRRTGGRGTGGQGGGSPGGERAGSGILKVAGTGRKRVKLRNISLYFGIDIRQTGENGYGKAWEAGGSDLPVPLHIGGF